LPGWLKAAAAAGLLASLITLAIAVYPIVDVVNAGGYAARISAVTAISNGLGVVLYRAGRRRAAR
jgi:hypothetical protein